MSDQYTRARVYTSLPLLMITLDTTGYIRPSNAISQLPCMYQSIDVAISAMVGLHARIKKQKNSICQGQHQGVAGCRGRDTLGL